MPEHGVALPLPQLLCVREETILLQLLLWQRSVDVPKGPQSAASSAEHGGTCEKQSRRRWLGFLLQLPYHFFSPQRKVLWSGGENEVTSEQEEKGLLVWVFFFIFEAVITGFLYCAVN